MREGHKHLFWFLLATSAALWGLKQRAFPAKWPAGPRSLKNGSQGKAEPVARPEAPPLHMLPAADAAGSEEPSQAP